jgi:glucose/arabinose dehydrogenase
MPTDFAFLPDHHVLISARSGLIWDADSRSGAHSVVLDLRQRTNDAYFRGLMTVAVDPNFDSNHFIYALYTVTTASAAGAPTTVRLTRFTLASDRTHDPLVLLGTVTGRSCDTLAANADCIPADVDHIGAQIAFGRNGDLFVSTGEGGGLDRQVEATALRAQDPNALGGKILHITRTGRGMPNNPYWNGDARANRSKVWATGLRNPFRLSLDAQTGQVMVGDVGSRRFDELDAVPRGANLGWPCLEGNATHHLYGGTKTCRNLSADTAMLTAPLKTYAAKTVIVGGTFLHGTTARSLHATYVYGSFAKGWLRGSQRTTQAQAELLARQLPGPVALHTDRRGTLYVLCFGTGVLLEVTSHPQQKKS